MARVIAETRDATEVRRNWSAFIDTVVHEARPVVVKRNRDLFAAMPLDLLRGVLESYQLTLTPQREADRSWTGAFEEIDLVGSAPSLAELKESLARDLIDYAQEYWQNFELYSRSPNRRDHLPYVLRVLLQPDVEHVVSWIHA